jgi:hypothetical protein
VEAGAAAPSTPPVRPLVLLPLVANRPHSLLPMAINCRGTSQQTVGLPATAPIYEPVARSDRSVLRPIQIRHQAPPPAQKERAPTTKNAVGLVDDLDNFLLLRIDQHELLADSQHFVVAQIRIGAGHLVRQVLQRNAVGIEPAAGGGGPRRR